MGFEDSCFANLYSYGPEIGGSGLAVRVLSLEMHKESKLSLCECIEDNVAIGEFG